MILDVQPQERERHGTKSEGESYAHGENIYCFRFSSSGKGTLINKILQNLYKLEKEKGWGKK